jgi:hypothetical protein
MAYKNKMEEIKEPQPSSETLARHSPFFYYSESWCTSLQRVNLLTGETSRHTLSSGFEGDSVLSELPDGILIITGGDESDSVLKIDTLRDFECSYLPCMHSRRASHSAVYHSQYLYVLGGYMRGVGRLSECERYDCAESRWEVLPNFPVAVVGLSAVVLENSLYALGGGADGAGRDDVYQLSLDSLTWNLMQVKLPLISFEIACFKTETQVLLAIEKTLYSFTPLEVRPIKTLPEALSAVSSCYFRGSLYIIRYDSQYRYWLEELTSL